MARRLDRVFAALSDSTRRDLLARLASDDATVGELAEPYDISLQAVSKHLGILEKSGLVTKVKEGHRVTVRLEPDTFDLMTTWLERYRDEAEARLERLDDTLAEIDAEDPSTERRLDKSGPRRS